MTQQSYDFILVSGLLHELESPVKFLDALISVCSANTVLHINVPNAYSIHRILALETGLIGDVFQQSETQKRLQQFSTFSMDSLTELLENCRFKIMDSGSYFIKPFTHSQMKNIISSGVIEMEVLDGLYELTKYIPAYGSEIFVDCRVNNFVKSM